MDRVPPNHGVLEYTISNTPCSQQKPFHAAIMSYGLLNVIEFFVKELKVNVDEKSVKNLTRKLRLHLLMACNQFFYKR